MGRWIGSIACLLWACLLGACDDGATGGGDPVRDASEAQTCRLNSDCPPGFFCTDRVCGFECRTRRDCPSGTICESGECLSAADMTVDDATRALDATGGRDQGFAPDARPPRDAARPDVAALDAAAPDARVVDAGPRREALGGPCERAFHCASDTCLSEPNNPAQGFCAQLCCSENDCPNGFGCLYFSGARFCFPSRLVPTNNFSVSAGGRCGGGVNDCRTGLCLDDRCLDSCCTDRDCLGSQCVWLPTDGGSVRAVCDRPNLLGGPAGSPCNGDLDCANRVCIAVPNGGAAGTCVDTCCTHEDCGGGFGCGQVAGLGGNIITACVPRPRGAVADGAACVDDAGCQSGHCVEGACRRPCCRDQDRNGACPVGQRCLPRDNGEGGLIRVCTPPDQP